MMPLTAPFTSGQAGEQRFHRMVRCCGMHCWLLRPVMACMRFDFWILVCRRLQTRPTHGLNETETPALSASERRRLLGSRSTVTVGPVIVSHCPHPAQNLVPANVISRKRSTTRQLLKDVLQGAFHAEKLWEAGFRGAGVKMGVFDTGIRPDHPHVKNIRCTVSSCQTLLCGFFCL